MVISRSPLKTDGAEDNTEVEKAEKNKIKPHTLIVFMNAFFSPLTMEETSAGILFCIMMLSLSSEDKNFLPTTEYISERIIWHKKTDNAPVFPIKADTYPNTKDIPALFENVDKYSARFFVIRPFSYSFPEIIAPDGNPANMPMKNEESSAPYFGKADIIFSTIPNSQTTEERHIYKNSCGITIFPQKTRDSSMDVDIIF